MTLLLIYEYASSMKFFLIYEIIIIWAMNLFLIYENHFWSELWIYSWSMELLLMYQIILDLWHYFWYKNFFPIYIKIYVLKFWRF